MASHACRLGHVAQPAPMTRFGAVRLPREAGRAPYPRGCPSVIVYCGASCEPGIGIGSRSPPVRDRLAERASTGSVTETLLVAMVARAAVRGPHRIRVGRIGSCPPEESRIPVVERVGSVTNDERHQFVLGVASNLVSAALLWLLALGFDLVQQHVWLTSVSGLVVGVAAVTVLPARTATELAGLWVLVGLATAAVVIGVALLFDGWVRATLLVLATLAFLYRAGGAWVLRSGGFSTPPSDSNPAP